MKFSLIVPAYNVQEWLSECLTSVSSQGFEDWECIVIDDGSTDNTYSIATTYSRNDSRFRVFHQNNKGLSAARNTGIYKARGEYVIFLDSDDALARDFLDLVSTVISRDYCDIVRIGFTAWNGEKELLSKESCNLANAVVYDGVAFQDWWYECVDKVAAMAPMGVVKKSVLLQCLFNENVKVFEDIIYSLNIGIVAKTGAQTNINGYLYRQARLDSLTTRRRRSEELNSFVLALSRIWMQLDSVQKEKFRNTFISRLMFFLRNWTYSCTDKKKNDLKEFQQLLKKMRKSGLVRFGHIFTFSKYPLVSIFLSLGLFLFSTFSWWAPVEVIYKIYYLPITLKHYFKLNRLC